MAVTKRSLEDLKYVLKKQGAYDSTVEYFMDNCLYYVDRPGEQYRFETQLNELEKYLYKQGVISSYDLRYYLG